MSALKSNPLVLVGLAGAGLGWVLLLVVFVFSTSMQPLGIAERTTDSGAAAGVTAAERASNQPPSFSHVRISQHSNRGLFSGRGNPRAQVMLLRGNRALAEAKVNADGHWHIAATITAHAGLHQYTLEQRLPGERYFVTGPQIRLHVPEGFRHSVEVTTKPDQGAFSLTAVAAAGDDIGSAASRRFDRFFDEQNTVQASKEQREIAERGDLLDPAWRWLEDANRSYHRDVVPRIKQRGQKDWQKTPRVAQNDEAREPEREWDRDANVKWPTIRLPSGISNWLDQARRGYESEVVPRLKGAPPVVTVARPKREEEETEAERQRRLQREKELEAKAVEKAERDRRDAERRRLEAERAERAKREEAARLADARRRAAEEERKRQEAERLADEEEARRLADERRRALEARSEEQRRLAEAEREKEEEQARREQAARETALAEERERLARLEREKEEEARRRREALEARQRERVELEAARQREEAAERRRREELRRAQLTELEKQREAEADRQREREEELKSQRFAELQRAREAAAERRRRAEAERDRLARQAREEREAALERRRAEDERERLARSFKPPPEPEVQPLPPIPSLRQVELPARPSTFWRRFVTRDTKIEIDEGPANAQRGDTRSRTRLADVDERPKARQPDAKAKRVRVVSRRSLRSRAGQRRTRALRTRLAKLRQRRQARSMRHRCGRRAGRRISPPGTYVVRRGDSLWKISRRHYRLGRYFRKIYRANPRKIRRMNLIFPCQRFYLPKLRRR